MDAYTIIKEVRREGRALVQEDLYTHRRTRGMEQKKQRVEALGGKERKLRKNQFNQPKYTFRVDTRANKHQIRQAVEQLFPKVQVTGVNTMLVRGKAKRKRTAQAGTTANWKKAIVTLREGDHIDLV